jgi:hypothetical protein
MNPKLADLLYEGFSINTLGSLSDDQLDVLYERVKKSKKETKEEVTKTTTSTTYSKDEAKGKTFSKGDGVNVTINQDDTVTVTKEGEVTEKAVSKKQHGLMGAAYSIEKGDKELKDIPKSYRGKVKKVVDSMSKKQVKDFAKTKTSKLPEKVESDEKEDIKKLEESILRLVENHINPQMKKSDILRMINKRK